MNIGLVRRGYSATGGAESYLRRLIGALVAAGHHCTLFAGPEWRGESWPADQGREVVRGRSPRAFADALAALEPRRRCDRLFSLERVRACDCFRAGDGVHRAWLGRRARFEPIWRSRLRQWHPKHRQLLELEDQLLGRGGARSVIANSRLVRDEILAHYPKFPRERIHVVYNGLPTAGLLSMEGDREVIRARTRAESGLTPGSLVILFVGTGWERKGLAHALAAFQRLPASLEANLLVAGRGNPRKYLAELSGRSARRVHFLGPVHDLALIYAAADLFVLPTLYDPFSNACLEALGAGLPVLTTPGNGCAEVLEAGIDGDVFELADRPPDTAAALAARIVAWSDPARRAEARAAAQAKAAVFTMERNTAETLAVLLAPENKIG